MESFFRTDEYANTETGLFHQFKTVTALQQTWLS